MRSASESIARRRSTRAFLSNPVAASTLETLLDLAQRAPSWCNTQPWLVDVVEGESLSRLSADLLQASRDADQRFDLQPPAEYPGAYGERRRESGYALYESVGIARADRQGRLDQAERNFSFFGAPVGLVISVDSVLGEYGLIDTGSYIATLLLAAESLDLGAVAQAAIAMHSDVVRRELDVPSTHRIVCGIAVGYPDTQHPINSFRTSRSRSDATRSAGDSEHP